MFVLTLTVGEYDDISTKVIAVSKNKNKLEERIKENLLARNLKIKIHAECVDEYNKLILQFPFNKPYPERPIKDKVPKTKEEHETWTKIKHKFDAECYNWNVENINHDKSIWDKAQGLILNKYNLPKEPKYITASQHHIFNKIDENNYNIINVEEI